MVITGAVRACFVLLVATVAALLAVAVAFSGGAPSGRRRLVRGALGVVVLAGWLALTDRVAASGALLDFSATPPRFSKLVAATALSTVLLALSPLGAGLARRVPLAALVGFQAFRLPVELILAELHRQGAIPVQMTFEGLNFDIATGLSAVVVAYLAHRGSAGRRAILAWNTAGLFLLAAIVVVANLSSPAFRIFPAGPSSALLATRPFIWLPTVLVPAALFGHVLVYRKLAREGRFRAEGMAHAT
jgi:hypothetical protein